MEKGRSGLKPYLDHTTNHTTLSRERTAAFGRPFCLGARAALSAARPEVQQAALVLEAARLDQVTTPAGTTPRVRASCPL